MGHSLNRLGQVERLGLLNHLREILQNSSPRKLRPFAAELGQIVPHAPAHVDEEHIVFVHVCSLRQRRHGVEADIHPAGSALVVCGHVVVELNGMLGVLFQEIEEVEVRFEAVLESCVGAVVGVAIVVLLQVSREGEDAFGDAPGPVESSH